MPTNTPLPKSGSSFLVYGIKSMHRAVRSMSLPCTPVRSADPKPKSTGSSFVRTMTNVGMQVLLPKPALPKTQRSMSLPVPKTSATTAAAHGPARPARPGKAPTALKPEPFVRKPLPSFKTPSPPRKAPVARVAPISGARRTCPPVVATCSPARAPILRGAARPVSAKKSVRWEMDSIASSSPSPIFDSGSVSPVSTAPSTPEPTLAARKVDVACPSLDQMSPLFVKAKKEQAASKVLQIASSAKQTAKTKSSANKENVMPRVVPAPEAAMRELVIAEKAPMSSVAHSALVQDLTRAMQKPQTVVVTENTAFGPRRVRRVVVPDYTGTPASADPNIQREITALRTQARVAAPNRVEHGAHEQGVSLRALEIINRVRRERGQEELKTIPRNMVATRT